MVVDVIVVVAVAVADHDHAATTTATTTATATTLCGYRVTTEYTRTLTVPHALLQMSSPAGQPAGKVFGDRLMAGRQTLDLAIKVRILVPEHNLA